MILDPNGMPILQPTVDNAETATFNTAFAAIGSAIAGAGYDDSVLSGRVTVNEGDIAGLAAAIDDSGWAAPTLLNSWAPLGGSFQTPRYRRINGDVHIEGTIKAGTINTIFTLPVEFRAPMQNLFLVACSEGGLQVYVKSNGDVTAVAYISGGSNALVSLSGISFAVS